MLLVQNISPEKLESRISQETGEKLFVTIDQLEFNLRSIETTRIVYLQELVVISNFIPETKVDDNRSRGELKIGSLMKSCNQ